MSGLRTYTTDDERDEIPRPLLEDLERMIQRREREKNDEDDGGGEVRRVAVQHEGVRVVDVGAVFSHVGRFFAIL